MELLGEFVRVSERKRTNVRVTILFLIGSDPATLNVTVLHRHGAGVALEFEVIDARPSWLTRSLRDSGVN